MAPNPERGRESRRERQRRRRSAHRQLVNAYYATPQQPHPSVRAPPKDVDYFERSAWDDGWKPTTIHAASVTERMTAAVRAIRGFVLRHMVLSTGVDAFEQQALLVNPVPLAGSFLTMGAEACGVDNDAGPCWEAVRRTLPVSNDMLGGIELYLFCFAEMLMRTKTRARVRLVVPVFRIFMTSNDDLKSMALHALAAALETCTNVELELVLWGYRGLFRRHVNTFISRLAASLKSPTCARRVRIVGHPDCFQERDNEKLLRAYHARALPTVTTILMGAHARVGASSPLRRLPPAILRAICELVEPGVSDGCILHIVGADDTPVASPPERGHADCTGLVDITFELYPQTIELPPIIDGQAGIAQHEHNVLAQADIAHIEQNFAHQ